MRRWIGIVVLLGGIGCQLELPTDKAPIVDEIRGKVVSVADGDTVRVLVNRKEVKVRLQGVDCPERAQAFGTRAREFTSELTFGKEVRVEVVGKDKYGRTLGFIILPDGRSLNRELVAAGLAWHYKQYSDDPDLAALETQARQAKRGLWSDPKAVAPWHWRRNEEAKRKGSGARDRGNEEPGSVSVCWPRADQYGAQDL